jgi:hypothetical protein
MIIVRYIKIIANKYQGTEVSLNKEKAISLPVQKLLTSDNVNFIIRYKVKYSKLFCKVRSLFCVSRLLKNPEIKMKEMWNLTLRIDRISEKVLFFNLFSVVF